MSDAIEQVAQVLNDEGACCGDCGREPGAPLSECPACERFLTGYARALADAGLLAPAPLREEWGIQWDDGVWEYYRSRAEAEVEAGDEGALVHRYVSDWMPVNPTEDDGSADQ